MKKQNWFWKMWDSSKVFKVLVFAIPTLLVFLFVRKIKKDKAKKDVRADIRAVADQLANSGQLGGADPTQRVLELQLIAENVSKAFWNFQKWAFGYAVTWRVNEDEELAIENLNLIANALEAGIVSDFYHDYNNAYEVGKGLSLRVDVNNYLNSSEKNRVHSVVLNSIK